MPLHMLLHVQVCLCEGFCVTSSTLWPSTTEPMGCCLGSWGWRTKEHHHQSRSDGHWTCCSLHQAIRRNPCCELAWTSFWLQKRHLLAAFIMSKESSLPSFTKQVPTQQDTALWLRQSSRSYGWSCAPKLLLLLVPSAERHQYLQECKSDPGGKGWTASRTCSSPEPSWCRMAVLQAADCGEQGVCAANSQDLAMHYSTELVLWAQSTTKGYIRANNKFRCISWFFIKETKTFYTDSDYKRFCNTSNNWPRFVVVESLSDHQKLETISQRLKEAPRGTVSNLVFYAQSIRVRFGTSNNLVFYAQSTSTVISGRDLGPVITWCFMPIH